MASTFSEKLCSAKSRRLTPSRSLGEGRLNYSPRLTSSVRKWPGDVATIRCYSRIFTSQNC